MEDAFMIHGVLSKDECEAMIDVTEELTFCSFNAGKNIQGALTWLVACRWYSSTFEIFHPV